MTSPPDSGSSDLRERVRQARHARRRPSPLSRLLADTSTHTLLLVLGSAVAGTLLLVVAGSLLSRPRAAEAEPTPTAETDALATDFPFLLERPTVAWFAPAGDVFDALPADTCYRPLAHYGGAWVQVELPEQGTYWLRASDLPTLTLKLDTLPDLMPPASSYQMYLPAPGETLHTIAAQGGSDPALIALYNHLDSVQVGHRLLIIPQIAGRSSTLPPTVLAATAGATDQPRVALTIDLEIGDERAQQLLNVLRAEQVQVTIFALGSWMEQHPDLVRQIIADGHELASHSYSHADFRTLDTAEIAEELRRTEEIAQQHGGTTRPFFRPPYGAYNSRVLEAVAAQGYISVLWNVDSQDSIGAPKTPEFLVESITAALPPDQLPGAIILSHCCNANHALPDALPAIMQRFRELGIEVRPVSDVLGS